LHHGLKTIFDIFVVSMIFHWKRYYSCNM